jgi:REP element-mobilizing transposase RayT
MYLTTTVFVPKGRKKALYGKVRKFLGPVFRELAAQRRSEIGVPAVLEQ